MDRKVRDAVIQDIKLGKYDFVWMGTPCSTYSALRSMPGGPRPLRGPGHLAGLPDLKPWERKKLAEGNSFTDLSADVMELCMQEAVNVPFTLENPEPDGEVSIFSMPRIKAIAESGHPGITEVNFDQCRFGGEATKPTRLLAFQVRYPGVDQSRCDHPLRRFLDENKQRYDARHRRVAGRKVVNDQGQEEWASKRLAEYPPPLCRALAEQIIRVARDRAKTLVDLGRGEGL